MKMITYQIPKTKYERYLKQTGSKKLLIDYLSHKIDDTIRAEAFRMKHRVDEEKVTLLIPVEESLFPILLEYCLNNGLSKTELINKILYRL